MSHACFEIPTEFRDELVYCSPADTRPDDEILQALNQFSPITSEKNVWAFWHSGLMSMPGWCQRNVISWVRQSDPSWTIRVLDSVPESPNYVLKYVSASLLAPALVDGKMDGPYSGPHSADLLRGACLFEHGGVFMDVGNILIRDLDQICWNQLEDPDSPFQVAVPWLYGDLICNFFVASRKGDPFIQRWHELFTHLWLRRTNSAGLINDPLLAFAKEITYDKGRSKNIAWDWSVSPTGLMEYVTQVACWARMCMLQDTGDGFSGSDYWQNNVLAWDAMTETFGGELTVGFVGLGEKMFDLLSTRLDADPNSDKYKQAYELVWRLLSRSILQKITHGKGLTHSVHLGPLWDEHDGKDCEPGTFAELLRYGTVHFRQTREIPYMKPPPPEKTLKNRLLEP